MIKDDHASVHENLPVRQPTMEACYDRGRYCCFDEQYLTDGMTLLLAVVNSETTQYHRVMSFALLLSTYVWC